MQTPWSALNFRHVAEILPGDDVQSAVGSEVDATLPGVSCLTRIHHDAEEYAVVLPGHDVQSSVDNGVDPGSVSSAKGMNPP